MPGADIRNLQQWLGQQIIGQEHLVERLIIALLADGHLLVEGAPGLAKTRAIKSLAEGIDLLALTEGQKQTEGAFKSKTWR